MATEILGASRPITPHDTNAIKPGIDFIIAKGEGTIRYVRDGGDDITFPAMAGILYPVADCVQIKETGTSATELVGF